MPSSGSGAASGVITLPDFSDIYDWVWRRLRTTSSGLPTASLDPEIGLFVDEMLSRYTCLGATYSDITGKDKEYFDAGIGKLVAAVFAPLFGISTGNVKRKKQGALELEFQQVQTAAAGKSLPEQWIEDAARDFSFIACIAALQTTANADFTLFALAGRRRAAERSGYVGLLINPVYDLVADEWRRLSGVGIVP